LLVPKPVEPEPDSDVEIQKNFEPTSPTRTKPRAEKMVSLVRKKTSFSIV